MLIIQIPFDSHFVTTTTLTSAKDQVVVEELHSMLFFSSAGWSFYLNSDRRWSISNVDLFNLQSISGK